MSRRPHGPVVLFSALSIYDRHGGTQRFNQRVIRTLAEAPRDDVSKAVVLSMLDRDRGDAPPEVEFLPCAGSRLRIIVAHVRCLLLHRPSVVLVGNATLAPLAPLTRVLVRRAAVGLFVHGIDVWDDPRFRRKRWFEPWTIRNGVDVILSVSDYTSNRMKRAYGLEGSDFRLFPNAVDVDVEAPPERRFQLDRASGPRILSVARLSTTEREKGLARAIAAVARLVPRFPGLRYDIVGDGELRHELAAQARDLKLASVVRFRGSVGDEELKDCYRESDLFLLPSQKEGFGIVFLEAWKHGVPVVCGNLDASAEVVTDGETGLAVDPNSVDAIADAVARLWTDRELSARIARTGYEVLIRRYTQIQFSRNLLAILRTLDPLPREVERP